MPATIIGIRSGFEYEPEVMLDNGRDGISEYMFSITGNYSSVAYTYPLDSFVTQPPDMPPGNFKVVRRNLEHIAGERENSLYRLKVSAQGGTVNENLYILEKSYSLQTLNANGIINSLTAQIPVSYKLIWLYPSVTITTNSSSDSTLQAEQRAKDLVSSMTIQIITDIPQSYKQSRGIQSFSGASLTNNANIEKVLIIGVSSQSAGGLYRITATAAKGASIE
jgi:hypothetical protein